MPWIVLVVRIPSQPARHRIAVWRELRKSGAAALGSGAWALPDLEAVQPTIDKVTKLTAAGEGEIFRLRGDGLTPEDTTRIERRYAQARQDEWAEFTADCDKYLAELAKEHATSKYTLAELEEEEQSLDRLRRWYRDLRRRDLLGTKGSRDADQRLKRCREDFDGYAEAVYQRIADSGA